MSIVIQTSFHCHGNEDDPKVAAEYVLNSGQDGRDRVWIRACGGEPEVVSMMYLTREIAVEIAGRLNEFIEATK